MRSKNWNSHQRWSAQARSIGVLWWPTVPCSLPRTFSMLVWLCFLMIFPSFQCLCCCGNLQTETFWFSFNFLLHVTVRKCPTIPTPELAKATIMPKQNPEETPTTKEKLPKSNAAAIIALRANYLWEMNECAWCCRIQYKRNSGTCRMWCMKLSGVWIPLTTEIYDNMFKSTANRYLAACCIPRNGSLTGQVLFAHWTFSRSIPSKRMSAVQHQTEHPDSAVEQMRF